MNTEKYYYVYAEWRTVSGDGSALPCPCVINVHPFVWLHAENSLSGEYNTTINWWTEISEVDYHFYKRTEEQI